MDIDKDKLVKRLQEIQRDLLADGVLSEIIVHTGDACGTPSARLNLDAGYWKSSTASCEGDYIDTDYYRLNEAEDVRDYSGPWYSSSANC